MSSSSINGVGISVPPTQVHPHDDLVIHVGNKSSRHGVKPSLIVLHDTESTNLKGLTDLQAIGNWFDNPESQASAHVCVDGSGHSARYVNDEDKAWSCVFYNSASLNIEQIGFAASTNGEWRQHEEQLREVARWVARWSKAFDIPLRNAKVTKDGIILVSGVIEHQALGNLGGGHHDCGPGYPKRAVLDLARFYKRFL